jgi:hypothetical protein
MKLKYVGHSPRMAVGLPVGVSRKSSRGAVIELQPGQTFELPEDQALKLLELDKAKETMIDPVKVFDKDSGESRVVMKSKTVLLDRQVNFEKEEVAEEKSEATDAEAPKKRGRPRVE